MIKIKKVQFPGVPRKVRVSLTEIGFLIDMDSLCTALSLDPARIGLKSCIIFDRSQWVKPEEAVTILTQFTGTHPAVRVFLDRMGEIGLKTMYPHGMTLTELAELSGVSEDQILKDLPDFLERAGR